MISYDFIFQSDTKDLLCTVECDKLEPWKLYLSIHNGDVSNEEYEDIYKCAQTIVKYNYEQNYGVELC